jgi:predicted  nucleic acid-binding Zn-ribbon protein
VPRASKKRTEEVIKQFKTLFPAWLSIYSSLPKDRRPVDQTVVDELQAVYECVTANDVNTVEEYKQHCADIMPLDELEAYFFSYIHPVVLSAPETARVKAEQKAKLAVEQAAAEVINKTIVAYYLPERWLHDMLPRLALKLLPLAMRVLEVRRDVDIKKLTELSPEVAAEKIASTIYGVWMDRDERERLMRQLAELQGAVEELKKLLEEREREVQFWRGVVNAIVDAVEGIYDSIRAELEDIAKLAQPLEGLAKALEELAASEEGRKETAQAARAAS